MGMLGIIARIAWLAVALAVAVADTSAQVPTGSGPPQEVTGVKGDATARIDILNRRIEDLEAKANLMTVIFGVVATFVGVVAGVPTILSMVASSRAGEAHQVAMAGERAQQGRLAEIHQTFLEGSAKTLTLVNDTLTLAKEASDRAARFIEDKARSTLGQLDREARSFLASSTSGDDRALVADPKKRSHLTSLAAKINGFEINRFMLPIDLELTPHCLFLRGMDFHLKQNFEDAFECWRNVGLASETPNDLRSLAWYWIGYENNNLGSYGDAEESFAKAQESATGARKFELRRIYTETKFFNKQRYSPESQLEAMEDLWVAINKEDMNDAIRIIRGRIAVTYGNILQECGRASTKAGKENDAVAHYYKRAVEKYRVVSDSDKWAQFGLAQCYYLLQEEQTQVQALLGGPIREAALREAVERVEPRTKVLARTTELICCLHVDLLRWEVPALKGLVMQALGHARRQSG
jgi:hypothetical protein